MSSAFIMPNEISSVIRKLLDERGIKSEADIFDFFYADLYSLSSPFRINGIYEFIERVREAVEQKEHILIYGDKDADGITAASVIYNTLKKITDSVSVYVPTLESGYGLNKEILEEYAKEGVSLVITCDCGISNTEEIAFLRDLGIDTIVTDHHDIPEILPNAYLIFNPKIKSNNFIQDNYCGAGVIFKIMQAFVFSYSEYYNADFIVLDFRHTDNTNKILKYIRAIRVRNMLIMDDSIFDFELSGSGNYVSSLNNMEDIELSIIEVLEDFASYAFDSEKTSIVCTGGTSRFSKLLKTYATYDVYPPPVSEVYDVLELAAKERSLTAADKSGIENFAFSCGINVFQYKGLKYSSLYLHAASFIRLFLKTRKQIVSYLERKLSLLALGTVADVVPLKGENRIFVKAGIESMMQRKHRGVSELISRSGFDGAITAKQIAWRLAPLINAAGRLGKPEEAVNLLCAETEDEAEVYSQTIHSMNEERKRLTDSNVSIVSSFITEEDSLKKVLIVKSNEIEQGLTGLIAGKLTSKYGVASLVVYEGENGECVGSARSKGNNNVRKLIESQKSLLLKFGGHTNAAGFSLKTEDFDKFKKGCEESAESFLFGEDGTSISQMNLSFADINLRLAEEIELLEPFGTGNEEPIFSTNGVKIVDIMAMGSEKNHFRFTLGHGGKTATAILFRVPADKQHLFQEGVIMDIVYTLSVNRYNGRSSEQLIIQSYNILESKQ